MSKDPLLSGLLERGFPVKTPIAVSDDDAVDADDGGRSSMEEVALVTSVGRDCPCRGRTVSAAGHSIVRRGLV